MNKAMETFGYVVAWIFGLAALLGLLYWLTGFNQLVRLPALAIVAAFLLVWLFRNLYRSLKATPTDSMSPSAWFFLMLTGITFALMIYVFCNLWGLPQGPDTWLSRNLLPEIVSIPAPAPDAVRWENSKLILQLDPRFESEVMVDGKKTGPYQAGNSSVEVPLPVGTAKPSTIRFYRHNRLRAGPYIEREFICE